MKKPISFKIAAYLYLLGMFCGIIRDLTYQSMSFKPHFIFWSPVVFGLLILISFIGYYLISRGLNWIRVVALVLYAITVFFFFLQINFLTREFEASLISGVLVLLSLILRGVSVYFMFNKSSNAFIKQKV